MNQKIARAAEWLRETSKLHWTGHSGSTRRNGSLRCGMRPNPRMQPTGRRGACLRSATARPERAVERKVCAGAGMIARS